MEGHRPEVRDGCDRDEHDVDSLKATSASRPYRAPRLKVTDKAVAVIRGAQTSGYTDRGHDFYHYGE